MDWEVLNNFVNSIVAQLSGCFGYFLIVIFFWLIFNKAGEKGWKALIPIYNIIILMKISGISSSMFKVFKYFAIFLIFVSLILFFTNAMSFVESMLFFAVFALYSFFFLLYIDVTVNLSYSFGHGFLFAIGLLFLTPLFLGILALDSSKYIGPQV